VATSKKKGNFFFSNSLFFEGEKNANFFEVKILLGAKTLPHFHQVFSWVVFFLPIFLLFG
jgi:hypothetical protein